MAIEKLFYTHKALEDIAYWKASGKIKVQQRIAQLLKSIQQNPLKGIGKPERLKYHHSGKWSRRITQKDRLIYEVKN